MEFHPSKFRALSFERDWGGGGWGGVVQPYLEVEFVSQFFFLIPYLF